MKKLIYILIILGLAFNAWGATVYAKKISGQIYYESGASSCDDVTAADTAAIPNDLNKAENVSRTDGDIYICAADYASVEVDSDGELGAIAAIHIERGTIIRGSFTINSNQDITSFGSGNMPIITGLDVSETYGVVSGTVYSKAGITTEPLWAVYDDVKLSQVEKKLTFDSGSTEPTVGEKVAENVGDAYGVVLSYVLSSGTWAGGDAAGYINLGYVGDTFSDNEQMDGTVSGDDFATADGDWADATSDLVSGQFSWAADTVYVNVGEDPDTGTFEICQRDRSVYFINRDTVTMDGIDIQFSNNYGILYGASDNITIQNSKISFIHGSNGKAIDIDATNEGCVVKDSEFVDNEFALVALNGSELATNVLFQNNEIHNTAWYRLRYSWGGGISFTKATGGTAKWNYIHDVSGDGILFRNADSNFAYNNLIVNTKDGIALESSDSNAIYNNTVYGATDSISGGFNWPRLKLGNDFGAGASSASNIIKNNIFAALNGTGNRRCVNGAAVNTNNTLDYNLYYSADDADIVYWDEGGGAWSGTLTEFKAAFSNKYEQNAPAEGAPLFVNAAADNFHLLPESSARDAGTNLGAAYDQDFYGRDQDAFGTGWDIGAILFNYWEYKAKSIIKRSSNGIKIIRLP